MQSLRIEMILPSLGHGGMEAAVALLTDGLRKHGHDVGITCLQETGALAPGVMATGVPVTLVPTPGVMSNFVPSHALRDHFRFRRPDVVHAHSGVWGKAARAARAARVPGVVHTAHGFVFAEPRYANWLRRLAACETDIILAVSEHLRKHLIEEAGLPPKKTRACLNPVDTDRFRPGKHSGILRERLRMGPSDRLIGCIARLDPIKNLESLLHAFKLVAEDRPDLRLALVGDGPMQTSLRAQAELLGLSQKVLFTGAMLDTAPAYRDLDVFVLPSHAEGTSISILEALASCVPVVATAVGGTPDILDRPPCGELVAAGNADALAEGIGRILDDRAYGAALARSGREKVAQFYSVRAVVEQHVDLYTSLLTRR